MVFGIFKREGKVYTEIVPHASKKPSEHYYRKNSPRKRDSREDIMMV
jgi:hypothetical protein